MPPAAYGFLADVTCEAERWRWMGPVRYDLVGAAKLAARCAGGRLRFTRAAAARCASPSLPHQGRMRAATG